MSRQRSAIIVMSVPEKLTKNDVINYVINDVVNDVINVVINDVIKL